MVKHASIATLNSPKKISSCALGSGSAITEEKSQFSIHALNLVAHLFCVVAVRVGGLGYGLLPNYRFKICDKVVANPTEAIIQRRQSIGLDK